MGAISRTKSRILTQVCVNRNIQAVVRIRVKQRLVLHYDLESAVLRADLKAQFKNRALKIKGQSKCRMKLDLRLTKEI